MKNYSLVLQGVLTWIKQNVAKMVMLSLLFSVLIFASLAIPYVNLLLSPKVIFGIILVSWYILFNPSIRLLLHFSVIVVAGAAMIALLRFREVAEGFGELLYILLIFLFIRFFYELMIQLRSHHES